MQLPKAPIQYDAANEAQARGIAEREDKRNVKTGGPYLIQSPNGTWWRLSVDDSGALSAILA